jgi:hypothetical protein
VGAVDNLSDAVREAVREMLAHHSHGNLVAGPVDQALSSKYFKHSTDSPANCKSLDRIGRLTPIESVKTREESDVILTVAKASVGKHPKAEISAALPDGTQIWKGGSKTRGLNLVGRNMTCVIAEDLISSLRNAMKKARVK